MTAFIILAAEASLLENGLMTSAKASERFTMKLPPRRQFLHLVAAAAALPTVSRNAGAQAWPLRPVTLIVGFAPGGAADIVARLIGRWLTEQLGQPFIIEN